MIYGCLALFGESLEVWCSISRSSAIGRLESLRHGGDWGGCTLSSSYPFHAIIPDKMEEFTS